MVILGVCYNVLASAGGKRSMGAFAFFAFVAVVCSSFYITNINSSSRSPQTSPAKDLDYYDADKEQHIVRQWEAMVSSSIDETTAMSQLYNEAEALTSNKDSRMFEYLQRAIKSNRCLPGLTRPECLVVLMYTDDGASRAFVKEFNRASTNKNWQPYRVYTTLLVSALRKLTEIDPIPPGATLYRGINFKAEPPKAERIFWKAFTSTSLDQKVAEETFGGSSGTILEFQPPASRRGARIRKLSNYYTEDEVLLLPFEEFHFLSAKDQTLYFSSSVVIYWITSRGIISGVTIVILLVSLLVSLPF